MARQMQCCVHSATLVGVKAVEVLVEVTVGAGMPGFVIVGMPDAAIQEARERVRSAIRSCGYAMPVEKVVVNLAPGSLKKTGSGFDLPIAAGILAATGQISAQNLSTCLLAGELSLDGAVRPVQGMLPVETLACKLGLDLLCPQEPDGFIDIQGLSIKTITTLSDLQSGEFGRGVRATLSPSAEFPDFADVGGHEQAKRAMQIAAAGGHGLLMTGPPGAGKTMLAMRLPGILPELTQQERLETAQVYSVVGEPLSDVLQGIRPFRSPHHSSSKAGLIGGGRTMRPGEVSLAHNGVLFLDELAEFSSSVLQSIRQPMEDGHVVLTRADGNVVFPANFMLVAASNPCPCGYFGDDKVSCTCSYAQVNAYQNRIGGPLMDRIDIRIDINRGNYDDVVGHGSAVTSAYLKEGVIRGREFASWRHRDGSDVETLRDTAALVAGCKMDQSTHTFLKTLCEASVCSARSIMRTLRLSRTIADIDESERVQEVHIAEAMSLRVRDGQAAS